MNANRLINMAIRLVLRQLTKGKKLDPNAKRAVDTIKTAQKINKFR